MPYRKICGNLSPLPNRSHRCRTLPARARMTRGSSLLQHWIIGIIFLCLRLLSDLLFSSPRVGHLFFGSGFLSENFFERSLFALICFREYSPQPTLLATPSRTLCLSWTLLSRLYHKLLVYISPLILRNALLPFTFQSP